MSFPSDWAFLPSLNLQSIFSYFTFYEAQVLALVCKNWSIEIDFYQKNRVVLNINRITSNEDIPYLEASKRHFWNIKLPYTKSDIIATIDALEALKNRNLKNGNHILHAFIAFANLRSTTDILSALGNNIKTLHLSLEKRDDSMEFSTPRKKKKSVRKLENLSKIEELKVEGFSDDLGVIAPYFKNLKTLHLEASQSISNMKQLSILEALIKNNPQLESLSLLNFVHTAGNMDFLKNVQNLKSFKSNSPNITFEKVLENNRQITSLEIENYQIRDIDVKSFSSNFQNLEKLHISFPCDQENISEVGLEKLWHFPKVRFLSLDSLDFPNESWSNAWFKDLNTNLTTVILTGIRIDDHFMEMFIPSVPNIETFEANYLEFGISFKCIQRMAECWKKLKFLELYLPTLIKFEESLLLCKLKYTKEFEKLETLIIHSDLSPTQFFDYLKSPSLRKITLDLRFYIKEIFGEMAGKENSNKVIPQIIQNCPRIEEFHLKYSPSFNLRTLEFMVSKMKSLHTLNLVNCFRLSLDSVRIVLENTKRIRLYKQSFFEEVKGLSQTDISGKLKDLKKFFNPVAKLRYEMDNREKWSILYGDHIRVVVGKLEDCDQQCFDFDDTDDSDDD
ncbi:hypothetical protein ACFFRR_002852 [Megaselia abdita]